MAGGSGKLNYREGTGDSPDQWLESCSPKGQKPPPKTSFTQICTVFYALLRNFALCFTRCTQIRTVIYELYTNLHDLHRVLRALTQICTVFYELYAHLHCVLRGLREFAPCFTSCTEIRKICTVFYEHEL